MPNQIIVLSDSTEVYKCGVYKLYHISSPDEIYIGSTTRATGRKGNIGFAVRFAGHRNSITRGTHASKRLIELCKCHGVDGLKMAIIEVCLPSVARDREQYYIDLMKPSLNQTVSAYNSLGYRHTKYAKEIMSATRKGRVLSEETKQKVSAALKGKMPRNLSLLHGKKSRQKVANKLRGRKRPAEFVEKNFRPIDQYSKDGELIQSFNSIKTASLFTNIDRCSISNCASGKRPSAGGFIWKFAAKQLGLSESRLK